MLFLLVNTIVVAGQGLESYVDSTTHETYEYWKPRYYDSIPVSTGWAGEAEQSFDQMIERYHHKDFEYVESISDKLNFMDTLIERVYRFFRDLFPDQSYELDRSIRMILVVFGGLVFLVLLYKLFFSGKKIFVKIADEEQDTEDQIAFVEKNLMQVDLAKYIQEAVSKQNYAVAVRYQLLYNIQLLHDKGYIDWRHTKTNMELMEDVSNVELRKEFLHCASIYDHVWFGDFTITQADYERYEQIFGQFQRRWK